MILYTVPFENLTFKHDRKNNVLTERSTRSLPGDLQPTPPIPPLPIRGFAQFTNNSANSCLRSWEMPQLHLSLVFSWLTYVFVKLNSKRPKHQHDVRF